MRIVPLSGRYSRAFRIDLERRVRVHFGFTTKHFPFPVKRCADLKRVDMAFRPLQGRKGALGRAAKRRFRDPFFDHIEDQGIYCRQVHSNRLRLIRPSLMGPRRVRWLSLKGTDGVLTTLEKVRLMVVTADCLSVFLVVPGENPWIALVHAGWRGTWKRIAERAVRRLRRVSGISPREYFAFFGPALRSCCYEVGREFRNFFSGNVLHKKGSKLYFDILSENRRQLLGAGVPFKHIRDMGACTFCERRLFYSHRRQKARAGRMISWIFKEKR